MLTFFLISNILDILCAKKLDHFCVRNRHQVALAPPQIRVRERKKMSDLPPTVELGSSSRQQIGQK